MRMGPGAQPVKSVNALSGDIPDPPVGLPTMYWVSFDIETNFSVIGISNKTDPIVIGPIAGQVRLRISLNGGASWIYSAKSPVLGPLFTNQPSPALYCSLTSSLGTPTLVGVKVFSGNLSQANNGVFESLFSWTPGATGPTEIPVVN